MKIIAFTVTFFLLLSVSTSKLSLPKRLLQLLRVLSEECNFHGFLYKGECFCEGQYSGPKCEIAGELGIFDTDDSCDDLSARLDFLVNISPNFYPGDDDMFSRFNGTSIGQGDAAYGEKDDTWIKLHDIVPEPFQIFNELEPTDIRQGALGDCYLLAAFVSLTTVRKGEIIREVFTSTEDNKNHVYVSRWLMDGKPRFVAVDDWVPGKGVKPFFASPSKNNDTWPVILEKAWAKIHGTYMAIEAGWHTDVWTAMTQAPGYDRYHSSRDTEDSIFEMITVLMGRGYPLGSATVNVKENNEVPGHAYSILGAFEVTLDNGSKVKLIRMYNPWNSEVWAKNPWGDNSSNWTAGVRAQVPYVNANDGAFYVSAQDYLLNFGATCWAETRDNYDISFQDIAFKSELNVDINYTTVFNYVNDNNNEYIYTLIDQSDTRLNLGCQKPFSVMKITVTSPNGTVYNLDRYGYNVKIANATSGNYTVNMLIRKTKAYVKYFTVTLYAPEGKTNFYKLANNDIIYPRKYCPNNCSDHGECNTYNGKCKCDYGWFGNNCSSNEAPAPPPGPTDPCLGKDCSNNGICVDGMCMCNFNYEGLNCEIHLKPQPDIQDLCKNITCLNNGTCDNSTGKCHCPENFKGDFCEIVPSKCSNVVCENGGVCLESSGICNCMSGFFGSRCENKDRCFNQTCSGNGQCDSLTGFCICNPRFYGPTCEFSSLCARNNCSGNGVCNQTNGQCECFQGFSGKNCQKDRCKNVVCKNGACDSATGKCQCPEGYQGRFCEKENCLRYGCLNNGTCNNYTGKCVCPKGFKGVKCEQSPKKPDNKIEKCSGKGLYSTLLKTCFCFPGYVGDSCEKALQFSSENLYLCKPGDCGHNGICGKDGCMCINGFTGRFCDQSPNLPVKKNYSDCSGNGFYDINTDVCLCLTGFSGLNCEIRLT